MKQILIVGAGFAGAVHARELAEAGYGVQVIDQRSHIAGNAYDHVDANGIRVHAYGPHLFHTRQRNVIAWIKRFADFVPYTHKVRAMLPSGAHVPLPINLDTVNAVFGTGFESASAVEAHLRRIAVPCAAPVNAADVLYSQIGVKLTDLFFRPYTKKMWGMELEEMSPAVTKRLPLRMDRLDTYFPAEDIQMMPRAGYTELFRNILGHPNISVTLGRKFEPGEQRNYQFCFNAMAIDEYYGYALGRLPYRSLRFHHRTAKVPAGRDWSVVNYTDDGNYTRETAWHVIPHHQVRDTGRHTLTREEPCDDRDNNFERFYPVKTADGRYNALYERYRKLADAEPDIAFIGRCGTYQYLDMDQVINQSLAHVQSWIGLRGEAMKPAA